MKYVDFYKKFVLSLYKDGRAYRDYINFESLALYNSIEHLPGWLEEIQKDLAADGYIEGPSPIGGDSTAIGNLTGRGMKYIEQNFFIPEEPEAPVNIPASNRVVRLDHNSSSVMSIREAASDLVHKIRHRNDLGNLSDDEAAAAANEVYQIGLFFEADAVRPSTVMAIAGPTLRWIADKAGGTLVGTAALALLAMIAAFLGIGSF